MQNVGPHRREHRSRKPARPSRRPDSRQELLDVALRIIAERGIDALRIEDVCEEVGVTKGSLYWHFQDRQGLV
ncbi:MAG: helix-turn-helix domain-containing protein, partial [Ilumatobacteraceae bacterium]